MFLLNFVLGSQQLNSLEPMIFSRVRVKFLAVRDILLLPSTYYTYLLVEICIWHYFFGFPDASFHCVKYFLRMSFRKLINSGPPAGTVVEWQKSANCTLRGEVVLIGS